MIEIFKHIYDDIQEKVVEYTGIKTILCGSTFFEWIDKNIDCFPLSEECRIVGENTDKTILVFLHNPIMNNLYFYPQVTKSNNTIRSCSPILLTNKEVIMDYYDYFMEKYYENI